MSDNPPELTLAVTAFIYDGARILGVSRKDNPHDYGLPGGKVEDGETLEEACIREVFEETGLTLREPQAVYGGLWGESTLVTTFMGVCDTTEALHTKEAGIPRWVSADELRAGSYGAYNTALLEALGWDAAQD